MPSDAKKIKIVMYDCQDSETTQTRDIDEDDLNLTDRTDFDNDDDKVLYNKIGKTEIQIDKVLTNLLVTEVSLFQDDITRNTKRQGTLSIKKMKNLLMTVVKTSFQVILSKQLKIISFCQVFKREISSKLKES